MPETLLSVTDLVAGYEGPVVGPLSFELQAGEIVALTGPNGAGKSTVFRALTGQARTLSGEARRAPGLSFAYQAQQGPDVGEIPLRGRELLSLQRPFEPSALPQRLVGLLDTRIDRLSGGQRQLFLVWAALLHQGRLLLLDEPTNNLDANGEQLLLDTLRALPADRGALVISHEPEFLRQVADRVVEVRPA